MKNGIFTLDWWSVVDAVLTTTVVAIIVAFGQIVMAVGFDVFTADWSNILRSMVNVGFIAGVSSLIRDFFSTDTGSVLGITPPVK